jgi:hypothetical protein
MRQGEPIRWDQIERIEDVRLTEHDANAAHITLISVPGKGFGIFFDFRYNGLRVGEHLEGAEEFFATATLAAERGHRRAFAENLFAAAELTAKALLLMLPFVDVAKTKKHGLVASKLNAFGRSPKNVGA